MGLVRQALEHAPRWAVRKLTATYLTLSLAEIGKAVGIADEGGVRAVVLSMVRPASCRAHTPSYSLILLRLRAQIERGEIDATLDATGTVTFHERETQFGAADVERLVREAQAQGATLGELDREVARSREFLTKVCLVGVGAI